jgi:D-alanine--poly(phosphoribitol) ligase subunit 2
MISGKDVSEIIYEAIDELNEEISGSKKIAKESDTVLFGRDSLLDSLGLVNLIITVEGLITDKLNLNITIVNEKAMSQKNSPFKSVQTLSDYILTLIESESNG